MNFEFFFCQDRTSEMQEEGSRMCDAIALGTSMGCVGAGSQNSFQKALQNFAIIFLIFS
jgi:hypothetical protein